MTKPIVLVASCTKEIGLFTFDGVGRIYSEAVAELSQCQPVLVPVGAGTADVSSLLQFADGLLLTGSYSNLHPSRYGVEEPILPDCLDEDRDALALPLLKAAFENRKPIFAICRGFQEINVAFGGTLHQAVHQVAGMLDHREPTDRGVEAMFEPAHPISIRGHLQAWLGTSEIEVNSLHGQGIAKLADVLAPEAVAPDGLVEAVRHRDDSRFCFGVQWHPEWRPHENTVSRTLFREFGRAVRDIRL